MQSSFLSRFDNSMHDSDYIYPLLLSVVDISLRYLLSLLFHLL